LRLLVLGGTHHVGRAVVECALARGDEVTTLNRGRTGHAVPGARALVADRRDPAAVRGVLDDETFDAAVDTWSQEPRVVRDTVALLADRVGHYGYVSSRSVFTWPIEPGLDESAPVVDGDAGSGDAHDYAAAKRGGELAVLEAFGGRAVVARAGLILGPYEDVGRLPWWLRRLERGGPVLAPGPPERPLQLVDGRDLAAWLLHAADTGVTGAFNTVSPPGHTTTGELLTAGVEVTGSGAQLVWVDPGVILAAGIAPWSELPIWVPPYGELAGLHGGDVGRAVAAGLACRPVRETVADTWAWMQAEGEPPPRTDRPPVGLDPAKERAVLDSLRP
jgi:nucleoside-diphosphate-sugar epimerase